MIYIIILFGVVIGFLVFFMFLILKKTVDKINEQTKSYFVDKLQVYDELIDSKQEKLDEINEQIENNKAKLDITSDTSNKNNYTFDSSILEMMNQTDYQHPEVLALSKKIDNEFDMDFASIIRGFIDRIDTNNRYDFYVSLRDKFSSEVIYGVKNAADFLDALRRILTDEEMEVYDSFEKKTFSHDFNDFLNYVDELITENDPYIKVLVGNKNFNFDYLSPYVKTIVSEDIYKGIKVIYQNRIYDFSLNERNV